MAELDQPWNAGLFAPQDQVQRFLSWLLDSWLNGAWNVVHAIVSVEALSRIDTRFRRDPQVFIEGTYCYRYLGSLVKTGKRRMLHQM